MASYYKTIDGVKYDRRLLEFAEKLFEESEKNQLSLPDVQRIHNYAYDGQVKTKTEEFTLQYITETFAFTDEALIWLKDQINVVPITLQDRIDNKIKYEGFKGMSVVAPELMVRQQDELPDQTIDFMSALDLALRTIMYQEEHVESPRALVRETHQLFSREGLANAPTVDWAVEGYLRRYMRKGTLRLLPLFETIDRDVDLDFNPPEDGENTMEHWIFSLALPTLSDHIYWAIIDRKRQRKAYVYGFN